MNRFREMLFATWLLCSILLSMGCAKKSDDFLRSGISNERQHKFEDALSDFDNAIRLDTNNARAYLGRALIACKTGFIKPVDDDLSKYIQLTAHDMAIAYIGRGLTKFLLHDFRASVDDLDKAIVVDPSEIQGYEFKEQVLSESGDTVRLKEFLHNMDQQTLKRMKHYVPQPFRLN